MASDLLSSSEVGKRLDCSDTTVNRWARRLHVGRKCGQRMRVFTIHDVAYLREYIRGSNYRGNPRIAEIGREYWRKVREQQMAEGTSI